MIYVSPSILDSKDDSAIEIHGIHFLPVVRSPQQPSHPHYPIAIDHVYRADGGKAVQLAICSECCKPKITISCGGQLEISTSGTICNDFRARQRSLDGRNVLQKWQSSVDLAASILRSLILNRFEHDYLNKVIHVHDIPSSPEGSATGSSRCVNIIFRKIPPASKIFPGTLTYFMNVLHPEVFTYRHSTGCLYSSEPELNVQDPDGSHKMAKTLHMKLCNGAYINIEGFVLGMTRSSNFGGTLPPLGAYDTPVRNTQELLQLRHLVDMSIADEDGMINRGFLTTASADVLALRESVMERNGKDYWLSVNPAPTFFRQR